MAFEANYDGGLAAYDDAIDKAEAEVIALGLYPSERPRNSSGKFDEKPELPPDLSAVTYSELLFLIGQFTTWHGYAIGQKIIAEIQANAAEKKRSFAWRVIRRLKAGTVADKDDGTGTDTRYMDADAQAEHYDAKKRLLAGIVETLKRDIETVSRAAAVMEQQQNAEGRQVGVSHRGKDRRVPSEDVMSTFRSRRR